MRLTKPERRIISTTGAVAAAISFALLLPVLTRLGVAQTAAPATPSPAASAADILSEFAPPHLVGPILAPYREPGIAGLDLGLDGASGEFNIPRPMGFNFERVPGMTVGASVPRSVGDTSGNSSELPTVYALGTDYAILVQGGPLIHRGSLISGLEVVRIDGAGVHLKGGITLRLATSSQSGGTQANGLGPGPSPSPSPAVQGPGYRMIYYTPPTSTPSPAPALTKSSVPEQDLLQQMFQNRDPNGVINSTTSTVPSPSPGGQK